eukprot:CAMPEP_0185567174 /NCGR_PEP_ID=MMETSP0434-20130131/532_1 /TAXON_ID=626734 ORGANISM="Favella taraikaensis, Strain Fe Narragansett Bay" /NCGR_SAMPLE_ID=MMETSP0434 /ASSEMBLY_ACC=CAM_ASM_000379 /LENGTH=66 /DNA_ID=CAMNT_0028181347 /DNA_START=37 /DNA_END=237 /DNA_ORIENTATION=+
MKKAHTSLLLLGLCCPSLLSAQNTPTDPVDPAVPEDYICGQHDADRTYSTWDYGLLCLFFDDMVPV